MSDSFFDNSSRVDKYDKRRKNTKLINTLIVVAGVLFVFFLFSIFFNDDDKEASKNADNSSENKEVLLENEPENNETEQSPEEAGTDDNETGSEDETSTLEDESSPNEETTEETIIEDSDDPNVLQTIVKDWQPIGTSQQEPHIATYDSNSQDWKEMWEAARYATGLSEGDYIEWRAENGGSENHVKITISNKAQTDTYRVYLEWITNQGWKPTKVDVLKVNDVKEKYYSDSNDTTKVESEEQ